MGKEEAESDGPLVCLRSTSIFTDPGFEALARIIRLADEESEHLRCRRRASIRDEIMDPSRWWLRPFRVGAEIHRVSSFFQPLALTRRRRVESDGGPIIGGSQAPRRLRAFTLMHDFGTIAPLVGPSAAQSSSLCESPPFLDWQD